MNIAIFGNTNNSLLRYAEGFQKLGHSVRLIINSKDALHRPESLYPEWADNYPHWVFDFSHITESDLLYETELVDDLVHQLTYQVDLAILNDVGPSLACYLKSPHVIFLTGSDVSYSANFDSIVTRSSMWDMDFKCSVRGRRNLRLMTNQVARQRDGIASAAIVTHPARGLVPGNDYILDTLGVTDKKRLDIWFANVDGIDPQPMPNNEKLSVFCGSRVSFRPDCHPKLSAQDFKGTDILLKGFGGYCRLGGQGKLSLIRKGQDVEAACQLIDELGIVDRVCWYDEMPTWQFYENMASADLICDQFSATLPGLVTSDAYALGRPVMANFRNESFSSRFPEVLPGFDVSTADEVADQLITLENNREVLTDMGLRSREYAEKYLSPKSMAASLLERLGQV